MQASKSTWYLDSYAFGHLTNNKKLFNKELKAKTLDFTIASGQIFWVKSVGTIVISLTNRTIKLEDVAYAPDHDTNLVSFGQLCKNNITFVNNKDYIILMKRG